MTSKTLLVEAHLAPQTARPCTCSMPHFCKRYHGLVTYPPLNTVSNEVLQAVAEHKTAFADMCQRFNYLWARRHDASGESMITRDTIWVSASRRMEAAYAVIMGGGQ